MFSFIAKVYVGHKKFYEEVLSSIENYQPRENYPGEYFSYLRSYADNIIFSQKEFDRKLESITDVMSALDFAINAEVSSILYYQEIKNIVPESKHHQINRIVDEERKHFVMLSEMKADSN
jgi:hypothetical protein